jgi:hypothetical protein
MAMAVLRRGLKAKQTLWLGAASLMLAACAAPYVDSRREAGQLTPVGTSNPNRVAICYSKTDTSAEEIVKLAESECAKTGRVPKLDHEDRWTCTMVAPRRIFYSCVAKP